LKIEGVIPVRKAYLFYNVLKKESCPKFFCDPLSLGAFVANDVIATKSQRRKDSLSFFCDPSCHSAFLANDDKAIKKESCPKFFCDPSSLGGFVAKNDNKAAKTQRQKVALPFFVILRALAPSWQMLT
jgi:hypothetical protein